MPEVFFARALLPSGWAENVLLSHDNGRITEVTPDAAPGAAARFGLVVPALANLHSHGFQRGMAGLSETRGPAQDSFWTWREVMYRFLARMTPDDVQAVTAMAYLEMLEGGFSRVGEFHYLHHDPDGRRYANPAEMATRIAAAAAETGIGLTLLPVFYAHGNFGGAPPAPGQRRFLNRLEDFAALLAACGGLVGGIAPHSLRAVTGEELTALIAMAGDRPIHMHIAEQTKEVADCLGWSGARPVEWLLDHAPVGPNWCLIHATHMTPAETAALARTGAVAGLCPITEANLGDGIFNGPAWLAAGGAYGVGTDSNVLIDAGAELRQLEYAQRLGQRARNVMVPGEGLSNGAALFTAALHGGGQALGEACGLAVGNAADFLVLAPDFPGPVLDGWIFGALSGVVREVWVGGRAVVRDGLHVARAEITARYRKVLAGLVG